MFMAKVKTSTPIIEFHSFVFYTSTLIHRLVHMQNNFIFVFTNTEIIDPGQILIKDFLFLRVKFIVVVCVPALSL